MQAKLDLTPFLGIGAEAIFFLTILIFLVFSVSLGYHLMQYSLNKPKATTALMVYLIISAFLIVCMTATMFAI
jgi:hypothetical protein